MQKFDDNFFHTYTSTLILEPVFRFVSVIVLVFFVCYTHPLFGYIHPNLCSIEGTASLDYANNCILSIANPKVIENLVTKLGQSQHLNLQGRSMIILVTYFNVFW